jgi:hypothetical protein
MSFNPGDYKIEQLRHARDFNIYPPVDANFRYETLSDDDPRTLDDTIVQDVPKKYTINGPPNKLHVIHGDFDNNPYATDMFIKGGFNGIPKKIADLNHQVDHTLEIMKNVMIYEREHFFKN